MYCPKCGTNDRDGVNFCMKCGHSFKAAQSSKNIINLKSSMIGSAQSHYVFVNNIYKEFYL